MQNLLNNAIRVTFCKIELNKQKCRNVKAIAMGNKRFCRWWEK